MCPWAHTRQTVFQNFGTFNTAGSNWNFFWKALAIWRVWNELIAAAAKKGRTPDRVFLLFLCKNFVSGILYCKFYLQKLCVVDEMCIQNFVL